ncbi:MAG: hypothetical protein U0575_06930 [Phycisphaerales bacterium]
MNHHIATLQRIAALLVLLVAPRLAMSQFGGESPSGPSATMQGAQGGPGGQGGAATGAQNGSRWPRTFTKAGSTVVVYQPQVDSWTNHEQIKFRSAVAVTPSGASQPTYGVVAAQADTAVNSEQSTVVFTNLQPAVTFPDLAPAQAAPLQAMVLELLPNRSSIEVPLASVLASMHDTTKPPTVAVNMQPPPIFHSDVPAIMVIYAGQPQFKPVTGAPLMFAVNTNWPVLLDNASAQYFLLVGQSWLTAPDPLKGPWTAAAQLPASFSNLPSQGWDEIVKNVPGQPFAVVPKVFTSTTPAELIVTQGPPDYTPIPGTRLMYTSNPVTPLFFSLPDNKIYFLAAGRWFRAESLTGPWSAASDTLPAEFAEIPPDSPIGYVLASVPNTQQASDAVLLAQVPHKSTINIADAKLDVSYAGPPKFAPIEGTSMQYATNSANDVVLVSGQYYCCNQGVWFNAPSATGPWSVCTSVPQQIYTIPPSCPIYNITYVQVYGSTPSTVTVGYTAGYSGEYVAATGALMFGAGVLTGALLDSNNGWNCYSPCYGSYGCGAYYHPGWGCYGAGGAYYGPHGDGAWGAAYNPATGTYSRAGYASTPYGSSSVHQAYNPWSDSYGSHASGTSGYGSWGVSTASQGSQWASAAHTTNSAGVTHGAATDSSGQWAEATHAGNSTVASTSSGDMYAGHDGNVYSKSPDGQWQKAGGSSSSSQPARPPTGGSEYRPGADNSYGGNTNAQLDRDANARSAGYSGGGSQGWGSRGGGYSGGDRGGYGGGERGGYGGGGGRGGRR